MLGMWGGRRVHAPGAYTLMYLQPTVQRRTCWWPGRDMLMAYSRAWLCALPLHLLPCCRQAASSTRRNKLARSCWQRWRRLQVRP